ncbi:hypothetical protein DH86_00000280 [Scytalidium sp. 3C]|nr:hypothetical protein DH86_00000280 [Scytalidium sp. 3C]
MPTSPKMRFQSVFLAAALGAISASASPVLEERQNEPSQAQLSQFADDIMSYATSLAANPKYTSALMDLATAMPNLVSSIQQYEATAVQDPQAVTAVPAFSAGNLRSESSLVVLAGGVLAGLLGTVFVL